MPEAGPKSLGALLLPAFFASFLIADYLADGLFLRSATGSSARQTDAIYYVYYAVKYFLAAPALSTVAVCLLITDTRAALLRRVAPPALLWGHLASLAALVLLAAGLGNGWFAGAGAFVLGRLLLLCSFTALVATAVAAMLPLRELPSLVRGRKAFIFIALALVFLYARQGDLNTPETWSVLQNVTVRLSMAFYGLAFGQPPNLLDGSTFADPIVWQGDFAIRVAPACAGLQGMSIAGAILTAYLFTERTRLRMGRAIALTVFACAMLFVFNALRIALLLAIGIHLSPEVAVTGFHAHFGILVSLGVLALALTALQHSHFAAGTAPGTSGARASVPAADWQGKAPRAWLDHGDVVLLMPLAVVLLLGLVLGLGATQIAWFYPVQLGIAAVLAFRFRTSLAGYLNSPVALPDMLVGVAVYLLWIAMVPHDPGRSAEMQAALDGTLPALAALWITARFLGSVLMAPLTEELAFRGGVMRIAERFLAAQGQRQLAVVGPLLVSALAFALLHSDFLAAFFAGLAYGVLALRRKSIAAAFYAHAITNFLLSIQIVALGQWGHW